MLCGDVNFGQIEDKVFMATPVPGGVGAVTTAVLAKHVLEAAKGRRALNSKGGKNGTYKPHAHPVQILLGDHGRSAPGLPCGYLRPFEGTRHHRRPAHAPQRH